MSSEDIILNIKKVRADTSISYAAKVQQEKELKEKLYQKTYKLLCALCRKYFSYANKRGYDSSDVLAAAWIGSEKAINVFEGEKGYKFNTFLSYHVNNAVKDFLGLRSGTHKIDIRTTSIYAPISDTDNLTLADTIEDDGAAETFRKIEYFDYYGILYGELEKLPTEIKNVLKQFYLQRMSVKEIAGVSGTEEKQIILIKNIGMRKLRQSQRIKNAYRKDFAYRHTGVNTFKSTHTSSTERAVLLLEDLF